MAETSEELQQIYHERFCGNLDYRNQVWSVLTKSFFSRWCGRNTTVMDLGCGYGEFINNIECKKKYGMDLNIDSRKYLGSDVEFLQQDCSEKWPIASDYLDVVFTSNFFEHLPSKDTLKATLSEANRCLKPGGFLIAMGPNIRYLPGAYWDFFDHHTILTDKSLSEVLLLQGYEVIKNIPKFLPYTMASGPRYPISFLRVYLTFPIIWPLVGRQFLIVAAKQDANV